MPEPVVARVLEPAADLVVDVALVESIPAGVETTPPVDASSRAEQLRGLFDTARVNSDGAGVPLAANTENPASETEEATRNG